MVVEDVGQRGGAAFGGTGYYEMRCFVHAFGVLARMNGKVTILNAFQT